MATTRTLLPDLSLDDDSITLYRHLLAYPACAVSDVGGRVGLDDVRLIAAITHLKAFHLLEPSRNAELEPVSPEMAAASLLGDEEDEIHRRHVALDRTRQEIMSLVPVYREAVRVGNGTTHIETICDVAKVRALLAFAARRTDEQVRIAHSGAAMSQQSLARSLRLDLPLLSRGVRFRSLLQYSTQYHAPTRHYVARIMSHGAEVRIVPVVPRRLILFDENVAFMPLSDDRHCGAVVIRDSSVIDYLTATFEHMWTASQPFPIESANPDDDQVCASRGELWQAIVNLLAAGHKDEVIARRIGLSVRTCRRHIAAIMQGLGAQSRFQAGVVAAQRGMTHIVEAQTRRSFTAPLPGTGSRATPPSQDGRVTPLCAG